MATAGAAITPQVSRSARFRNAAEPGERHYVTHIRGCARNSANSPPEPHRERERGGRARQGNSRAIAGDGTSCINHGGEGGPRGPPPPAASSPPARPPKQEKRPPKTGGGRQGGRGWRGGGGAGGGASAAARAGVA